MDPHSKQRQPISLWVLLFAAFAVLPDEQPPRPASAQPEARHVGCFLTAVGVPRLDPRPEGKGAGVQNAGRRAPVGRLLHWAVSGLGSRGFHGLAITDITGLAQWLRAVWGHGDRARF